MVRGCTGRVSTSSVASPSTEVPRQMGLGAVSFYVVLHIVHVLCDPRGRVESGEGRASITVWLVVQDDGRRTAVGRKCFSDAHRVRNAPQNLRL